MSEIDLSDLYILLQMFRTKYFQGSPDMKKQILNMQANVSSIFYATYPGKTIGFVHPHNVRGAGRHKFYSNAFETEILELRSRGLTMPEIANKTGCSKSNVSKLIRKHS